MTRPRTTMALTVATGVVVVTTAIVLPSRAETGPPVGLAAAGETAFRAAGDGSLPAARPPLREPAAPVSTAEQGYAIRLARAALPTSARDVLGAAGGEIVGTGLPSPAERTAHRQVDVTAYDYATDRVHRLRVDLSTGTVVRHDTAADLHPPPTTAEAWVALDLALTASPAPAFVEEYRALTGAPLIAPEQVHAVAGTWRPGGPAPAPCGSHRCVQLLVALPSGQYLGTQDLAVDLSAGTVIATGLVHDDAHQH